MSYVTDWPPLPRRRRRAPVGSVQSDAGPTQASSRLPLGPDAVQARLSARCMNVSFEGAAALAVIEVAPGVFTLGTLRRHSRWATFPGRSAPW